MQRGDDYAAKSAYEDPSVAREYDYVRFQRSRKQQRKAAATENAILRALSGLDGVRELLDAPCGTGRLVEPLMRAGFSYTGADISEEMLAVARTRSGGPEQVRVVPADLEDLPFEDGDFDCVVFVRFLNLIPSEPRVRVLKEFHRVSRRSLVCVATHLRPAGGLRHSLRSMLPRPFRGSAGGVAKARALLGDILESGWQEHFWVPYRTSWLSRTRAVGVFSKTLPQ